MRALTDKEKARMYELESRSCEIVKNALEKARAEKKGENRATD